MPVEYTEKRRWPRYPCDTGVRFLPEGSQGGYWGTVSDISLGGCYIYTFSPLPVGQAVVLVIKTNESEMNVAAKTVSSHPGVGMGAAFQRFLDEDGEERLTKFISSLARQPKADDTLSVFH